MRQENSPQRGSHLKSELKNDELDFNEEPELI